MKTLHEVTNNDALVHRMMRDGMNLKDIICAMSERHDSISKKLMDLELLAPKRFRFTDGVEAIYRAPADLIPVTELPGPSDTFENFVKPKREIMTAKYVNDAENRTTLRSTYKTWEWKETFDSYEFDTGFVEIKRKHLVKANLYFDIQEV